MNDLRHEVLLKELVPFDKIIYIKPKKKYIKFVGKINRTLYKIHVYNDGHTEYI